MLRFVLDDYVVQEEPDGWADLVQTLRLDLTERGRLLTVDTSLKFYRDGYRYLRDRWDAGDLAGEVRVVLEEEVAPGAYEEIYRGIIKPNALRWTYAPAGVEAAVDDDSYFARIKNNQGLEVRLDLPRTKNDRAVTPPPWYDVTCADPSTGTNFTPKIAKAADVARFLVEWMSDGEVGFRSDLLTTGALAYLGVGCGRLWREPAADYRPACSWRQFLAELAALRDVLWQIETGADGRPTLRLELATDLETDAAPAVVLADGRAVTESLDAARLWASVRVGSAPEQREGYLSFPEGIRYRGFSVEQYQLQGQGNVDAELDLSGEWIRSSNVLEKIYVDSDEGYDEDLLWLEVDWLGPTAVQANWLTQTPPPLFFNPHLTNEYALGSYLGNLPGSIAAELGNNGNGFYAWQPEGLYTLENHFIAAPGDPNPQTFQTSPQGRWPNDYTAPGYDADGIANNYGNGTAQGTAVSRANSFYTAPATGVYNFRVQARLNVQFNQAETFPGQLPAAPLGTSGGNVQTAWIEMHLDFYDAANVLLDSVSTPRRYFYGNCLGDCTTVGPRCRPVAEDFVLELEDLNRNLQATDKAVVVFVVETQTYCGQVSGTDFILSDVRWRTRRGSYFGGAGITGGGIFATVDSRSYRAVRLDLTHPLTRSQWAAALAAPTAPWEVQVGDLIVRGWPRQVNFRRFQNTATVQLVTAKNYLFR